MSPSKRVPLATQRLVTRFDFAKLMHETCLTAVSFCMDFSGVREDPSSVCFMFVYCLSDPVSFLFSCWIISPFSGPFQHSLSTL